MLDVLHYNKRKDGAKGAVQEFFKDPSGYQSNFMPYAKKTHYFIAGHFYGNGAPYLFTREDAKNKDHTINLIADISCDIDGPVAPTIKASTIADPLLWLRPPCKKKKWPLTHPEPLL